MGKHDVLWALSLKIIAQYHRSIERMIRDVVSQSLMILWIQEGGEIISQAGQDHFGARQNPIKGVRARSYAFSLEMIGRMTKTAQRHDLLDGGHSGHRASTRI